MRKSWRPEQDSGLSKGQLQTSLYLYLYSFISITNVIDKDFRCQHDLAFVNISWYGVHVQDSLQKILVFIIQMI